jgi:hypothetical protein
VTEWLVRPITQDQRDDVVDIAALLEQLRPSWQVKAACRGQVAVMFPTSAPGKKERDFRPALAICARCVVIDECRRFGAEETHGVWGARVMDRYGRKKQ